MPGPAAIAHLTLVIDRTAPAPALSEQIHVMMRDAIREGRIAEGARLPSWRDLAAQLGVARGTVQTAYERLADELLIVSAGAAGTRVAGRSGDAVRPPDVAIGRPLQTLLRGFSVPALPFQGGTPAQDAFPSTVWSRCLNRAVREDAAAPVTYSDPRGDPGLRAQIASQLAITRGLRCVPDQIFITGGYRAGLGLTLRALGVEGGKAWMEEPGYPVTRMGLEFAGLRPVPVRVDREGLDVEQGMAVAPDAVIAVVTPGQQAPLGVCLSADRRSELLAWADRTGGWIIEDDYLGELQLSGRTVTALAARDHTGRVIHIGSFSKTMKPALGLGFVVVPRLLAERFGDVAATLSPAFNTLVQNAMARFISDGHYIRHLRHMKRLYLARREAFERAWGADTALSAAAGPMMILNLPAGTDDVAIARAGPALGIAPTPLSVWRRNPGQRPPGLLLSVTNLGDDRVEVATQTLRSLIDRAGESVAA